MKDSILYYSVGPLLYCPANHKSLANSLIHERFGRHFSLAVCLEDTIRMTALRRQSMSWYKRFIHFLMKKRNIFFFSQKFS